jgi:hypothetical protein
VGKGLGIDKLLKIVADAIFKPDPPEQAPDPLGFDIKANGDGTASLFDPKCKNHSI